VALAGCGGPEGAGGVPKIPEAKPGTRITESVPGPPVDGDWLIRQIPAEPPHLNPLLATGDYYTQLISSLVYDSLLERDNETLELKPVVAESWEVSPDHLTFTFKLRKDVKFS